MTPQQGHVPHMERRVLDPADRAVVRKMNDTYIVTAGLGIVLAADYDAAYITAYHHNVFNGHPVKVTDRRKA